MPTVPLSEDIAATASRSRRNSPDAHSAYGEFPAPGTGSTATTPTRTATPTGSTAMNAHHAVSPPLARPDVAADEDATPATESAITSGTTPPATESASPADTTPPAAEIRPPAAAAAIPAVRLTGARLAFGERTLWQDLDLEVRPGEFIAVLGPNGSGKTSMLKMLLGQVKLSAGTVEIAGSAAHTGNPDIGYVPQQKTIDGGAQLRGIDLVGLGVDGHRWGFGLRGRKERKAKVAQAISDVGAERFAYAPLDVLSGGEQQRLRVAQALVGDPRVLLCDEPLLSLDMANQRLVSELIDKRRRTHDTAVLFVTHELNPILPLVDRVLYLVDGKFRIGTPDEVMTSEVLSELYRTQVDVLHVRGRLVVVGTGDSMDALGSAGHCHGEDPNCHEDKA